jgi:hypothetical protein
MKLKIYREVTLQHKMYCVYEVKEEFESYIKAFPFELENEDAVYKHSLNTLKKKDYPTKKN